jgi:hypothetical protein
MATVGADTGNQVSANPFEHRTPRDYEGIKFFIVYVFSMSVKGRITIGFPYLAGFASKCRLITLNVVAGYQYTISRGDIAWFYVQYIADEDVVNGNF